VSKKILVIDDDLGIVRLIEKRLSENGFKVNTAFDGEQGLAKLSTYVPDLILLDVEMPKLDGYNFMMKFKEKEKFKEIPVVVLTSHAEKQPIFELRGVRGYLVKPVNFDALFEKINGLLFPKNIDREDKVLVIEGNSTHTKLMAHFLGKGGFKNLQFAKDGSSGIKMAQESKPGLIVINVKLSDSAGSKVSQDIKSTKGYDPKIVFLCDDPTQVNSSEKEKVGANIIAKSSDYEDLIEEVRRCLDF